MGAPALPGTTDPGRPSSTRGRLERSPEGVLNLVADRLSRLDLAVAVQSRDFR
jgi:hypothetical protein